MWAMLMQHSRPTLTFKPIVSLSLTSYLLPLHPHHCLKFLAVFLYLLLLVFLTLTPSGFFNEMLEVSESRARNYYALFCVIPLLFFISRNLTLIHLHLSGSLNSLLSDLIALTPGVAFSIRRHHFRQARLIF